MAGNDPKVNEEWNCDKGRWAFTYARERDRLTTPMVRGSDGGLVPATPGHRSPRSSGMGLLTGARSCAASG